MIDENNEIFNTALKPKEWNAKDNLLTFFLFENKTSQLTGGEK